MAVRKQIPDYRLREPTLLDATKYGDVEIIVTSTFMSVMVSSCDNRFVQTSTNNGKLL